VDVRIRRVLADEGLGGVLRRFLLAQFVIGKDDVQSSLPRLCREGIARIERLIYRNRLAVVVGTQRLLAAVVQCLRREAGEALLMAVAGAASKHQRGQEGQNYQTAQGGEAGRHQGHPTSIDEWENAPRQPQRLPRSRSIRWYCRRSRAARGSIWH